MVAKYIRHISFTFFLLGAVTLPLVGCGKKNEYKAPPPLAVTVAKPVHGQMVDIIETNGLIASTQVVEIRAQVQGLITKINFQDGQEVEEGQILFEIDARQYSAVSSEAQAKVADLQAQAAFSRSDFARSKELYAGNSISKQEYEQSRQQLRALEAQVQAAEASQAGAAVELDFTKVKAPISGRISRRYVDRGQLVGAGDPTLLATVVASKDTYVEFSVSESELLTVRQYFAKHAGSREAFLKNRVIRAGLRGEDGFPHEGRIDSIENMVSASTGTLEGRGIFVDSAKVLFPGLFCRVEIPLGTSEGLAVPEEAIMLDQVGRYVFVVDKEERIQRKPVSLGSRKGSLRRIDKGLSEGDLVVIRGQARVRVGSRITKKEETLKMPSEDAAPPKAADKPAAVDAAPPKAADKPAAVDAAPPKAADKPAVEEEKSK